MHTLQLLKAFFKVNLQMSLAYRVDTWVNIGINLMWLAWELLALSIVFSNTDTLAGWGPGEMIALLGVFRLVNALMSALIWPNTERFNASVRDGSLDYTLLQPANSLFLVTFSRMIIWRAWDFVLAAVLIVIGLRMSGSSGIALNLPGFIALALSGMLIIYSLWVALIALTFWFVKFDNNVTLLQALLDTGRFPAMIYPPWLRLIITFVIPIAVATTTPMQALRGDLSSGQIMIYLVAGVASFAVALRVWQAGVRRYSGASS